MQRGRARWAKQLGGADGLGEGVLEERLSGEAGREHCEGEIEKDGWKGRLEWEAGRFIRPLTLSHSHSFISYCKSPPCSGDSFALPLRTITRYAAQVNLTWDPPLSESSKVSEIESKETFRTSLYEEHWAFESVLLEHGSVAWVLDRGVAYIHARVGS